MDLRRNGGRTNHAREASFASAANARCEGNTRYATMPVDTQCAGYSPELGAKKSNGGFTSKEKVDLDSGPRARSLAVVRIGSTNGRR